MSDLKTLLTCPVTNSWLTEAELLLPCYHRRNAVSDSKENSKCPVCDVEVTGTVADHMFREVVKLVQPRNGKIPLIMVSNSFSDPTHFHPKSEDMDGMLTLCPAQETWMEEFILVSYKRGTHVTLMIKFSERDEFRVKELMNKYKIPKAFMVKGLLSSQHSVMIQGRLWQLVQDHFTLEDSFLQLIESHLFPQLGAK